MKLEKLRGGEHDVPRAIPQRVEELFTLLVRYRTVGAKKTQPERVERSPQRFALIVRQRAQRIDDQGPAAPGKGTHRGGELKAERLSATGAHHRERVLSCAHAVEHVTLRLVWLRAPDQRRTHQLGRRRLVIQLTRRNLSRATLTLSKRSRINLALDENVDPAKFLFVGTLC